jgi:hypothetical protein
MEKPSRCTASLEDVHMPELQERTLSATLLQLLRTPTCVSARLCSRRSRLRTLPRAQNVHWLQQEGSATHKQVYNISILKMYKMNAKTIERQ